MKGKKENQIQIIQVQQIGNKQLDKVKQKKSKRRKYKKKGVKFLYFQLRSFVPGSIDHLHVGDGLCVRAVLYPPQTPFYCSVSRAWFGNCSL